MALGRTAPNRCGNHSHLQLEVGVALWGCCLVDKCLPETFSLLMMR